MARLGHRGCVHPLLLGPVNETVRSWRPSWRPDPHVILGPLRRGSKDPTYRVDGRAIWRTIQTPYGPATQRIERRDAEAVIDSSAWGPGAQWATDRLPRTLGADDDPRNFDAEGLRTAYHREVGEAWRRYGEQWRVPAVGTVFEVLAMAILEQKVTGIEARRAWSRLLAQYGDVAPGPAPQGMYVSPSPEVWRAIPSWEWHRAGVDAHRSRTIVEAARVARRLEECDELAHEAARTRLLAVPGVGGWTAAEVAQRSLGDPDAVSFGDFHLAGQVVFALTGEPDGDDARMAEVLAPWAGQRLRAIRMVELSGVAKPRHAPRMAVRDFRSM